MIKLNTNNNYFIVQFNFELEHHFYYIFLFVNNMQNVLL
jgi:hypothetical protein